MKNSKYIKVSVSERMPEKEGDYFISSSSMAYEGDRGAFFNGTRFIDKYGSNMPVEYWLEEKPDYESELENMIDELILELDPATTCGDYQEVIDKAKSLLTKLKTES